ncbi:lactonase family protein [Rubritalea spongiae]|uniref:Lactonase family protein n=1 Tax=Rubritalea spongiae TaxID=430797 RepID=A0ABW5E3Y6_9BACT
MKKLLLLLFSVSPLQADQVRVYFGTGAEWIYSSLFDTDSGKLTDAEKMVEVVRPSFITMGDGVLYSTSNKFGQQGGIAALKVAEDGGLSLMNEKPSNAAGNCHVSLDASGKLLFFANYSGGSVGAIALKEDGSLSDTVSMAEHEGSSVHESRQKGPHPHSMYHGPENKYAYAPDLGTDEIWTYRFDLSSGKLNLIDKAKHPDGGGPRHMKFSKDGNQAYVLSELTLETVIYDRDRETGKLTARDSVSNLEEGKDKSQMTCSEIRVSEDGKFVYAANRDLANKNRDSVSVFEVKTNGGLELVQVVGAEVWIPRNINISPDGKWLLVAGQKSDLVTVFSIDTETGQLEFTGHKVKIPSPMCVEFMAQKSE